jgi:flagellar hook-length control protein FliK
MPTIDFNQLSALSIADLTFPEPTVPAARDDSDNLFGDYLKRANSASTYSDAENRKTNDRDAERLPPPKNETAPAQPEHPDAASPKNSSNDGKNAQEEFPRTETDNTATVENSSSKSNEKHEEKDITKVAKQGDPEKDDVQSSEKDAVKEKKKTKDEKIISKQDAESAATAQKIPVDVSVIQDVQPSKNTVEKDAVVDQTTVMTATLQDKAPTSLQGEEQPEKNDQHAVTDAVDAHSRPKSLTQLLQEKIAAGEIPPTSDPPSDKINDGAGEGKTKAKKTREAAAEAKGIQRKQKLAGESQAATSTADTTETQSTATGKEAADAAPSPSSMPQALPNVMQSVLEVLKNAEKPSQTEDSNASIAGVRANPAVTTSRSSATHEGGPAPATPGSDAATHAIRAQFVQRVERAFAAMGQREGNVRLKLSPPALGVLKLEIGVHKGVMKARVEAETPAAKSLLLENLPELRDRLAQQNIHIQQFDVDLMDRSPGGMPQHTFSQNDSGSQQGRQSPPRANLNENAAGSAPVAAAAAQRPGTGSSLNVIV